MEEMYEEPRSRLGRKGYIKRWLTPIAVGVLVGIGRVIVEALLPADLSSMVSLLILAVHGLPALAFSVVWTMQRAADAGKNEALALLILVPVVNIVALVVFSSMPSAPEAQTE